MTLEEYREAVNRFRTKSETGFGESTDEIIFLLRPDLKPKYWVKDDGARFTVCYGRGNFRLVVYYMCEGDYTKVEARELAKAECARLNAREQT